MPIIQNLTTPNGTTVSYHRITQVQIDYESDFAKLTIRSYVNEEAATNNLPHAWTDDYLIPTASIEGGITLREDVEQAVIRISTLPFYGGSIATDQSGTLEAAKDRAWTSIKAARAAAEEGNFTYDGGLYQADKVRINGAVQLAVLAKSSGAPFSETWTLVDNTTRTLSADQVIQLGIALGQYVSELYAKGRALRQQINEAGTVDAVQAINWNSV